jgi:Flp pilus assembly protein TadG
MNKILRKPSGQIAVIYAGIIAVLLGAIALSTDVAVMYVNWQTVQKAADAGALAGAAQFLPTAPKFTPAAGCGGNVEKQAGCTYAFNNSAALSEISVAVPAATVPASVPAAYASQTVQVTVNRTNIPVLFGAALGITTPYQANVTATAVGPLPLSGARNPFPAGIPSGQPMTPGTQFSLTNADPSKSESYGPGNWGWLDIGGSGASNLADNITSGCDCNLSVGQSITPKTGESWGQVSTAVDGLITNPGPPPATLTGNESQLITVPIVTPFTNGSSAVTILGFAEVWLVSDIVKGGKTQTLTVQFVKFVPKDGLAGGGPTDFGAYSKPALVQ